MLVLISNNQHEIETLKKEVKKLENKIKNMGKNNKRDDQQVETSKDKEEYIYSEIQENINC